MAKNIIKENSEKTVSDEQLSEFFEAAYKTEQQIINLCIAAMKNGNPQIMKATNALKSNAANLITVVNNAIVGNTDVSTASKKDLNKTDDAGMDFLGESEDVYEIPDEKIDRLATRMAHSTDHIDPQVLTGAYAEEDEDEDGYMMESVKLISKAFNLTESNAQRLYTVIQLLNESADEVTMSKKKFKKEHNKLVKVLNSPSHKDDKKEAQEQQAELDSIEECDSLDLTKPYMEIKEGFKTKKFEAFKSDVVAILIESNIATRKNNFAKLISEVAKAKNPKDYETAMNSIYDFADQNSIEIKTI